MKKRFFSNIISRGFGKFASYSFPSPLQKLINSSYVKFMKLDMKEFKSPKEYKSLNELFTRKLEVKREIDLEKSAIISPCDALVTEAGEIKDDRAMQIKGMEYSVKELLKESFKQNLKKYINFYLSPKDYHRYHMPYTLKIERVTHIPGRLYPVNLRFLKKKIGLFIENERVVLECVSEYGTSVVMVLVGALNVGKMTLVFEPRIQTNRYLKEQSFKYDNLWLKKGELLGYFKMGSTILMFFDESVDIGVKAGDRVKFGKKVANIKEEV